MSIRKRAWRICIDWILAISQPTSECILNLWNKYLILNLVKHCRLLVEIKLNHMEYDAWLFFSPLHKSETININGYFCHFIHLLYFVAAINLSVYHIETTELVLCMARISYQTVIILYLSHICLGDGICLCLIHFGRCLITRLIDILLTVNIAR